MSAVPTTPALLSASNAMPAVIAPSPMTATHLRLSPFSSRRDRHAERGRDRGRRMRGAEGVVLALVAARKARDAAELAQRRHPLAPAGQDLVRIGLVADVPDQAVVRRVEDVVQRDRQLDRAEVRREVAAGLRHASAARTRAARRRAACSSRARQAAHVGRDCRSLSSSLDMCFVCLSESRSTTRSASSRRLRRVGQAAAVERGVRRARAARSAWRARGVEAEHGDVGRLVVVEVLAGGLAERRRGLGDVEDVVDDLEGEADRVAVVGQRLPLARRSARRRPRPSARWRAAARRSCGGACRTARARRAAGRRSPGRSPGRRPCRRGRRRAPAGAHRRACKRRRDAAVGRASAPRRPAPASRRRRASPGPRRTARAPSACRGAGRRRPCTACRRGRANRRGSARPRRRRAARRRAAPCDRLGGGQHEQRPQPLAAVEHGVAHRLAEAGRRIGGHPGVERRLDRVELGRAPRRRNRRASWRRPRASVGRLRAP